MQPNVPDELEYPSSLDELYRARGDDVPLHRPIMSGDIFRDVAIPGVDDPIAFAMVATHPCSMRAGPAINEHLLMLGVVEHRHVANAEWRGFLRIMPLPGLVGDDRDYAAKFEFLGRVKASDLSGADRIACLEERGILLLFQRFTHYLTRFAPPTSALEPLMAAVFAEVDLLEEWVTRAVEGGREPTAATADFDAFLTSKPAPGGDVRSLQVQLGMPERRAFVRRTVRGEIARL
jgi:hypothetical protein